MTVWASCNDAGVKAATAGVPHGKGGKQIIFDRESSTNHERSRTGTKKSRRNPLIY